MENVIRIKKKSCLRGDDGYKIISVRIEEELAERLDELAGETNRSRNEIICLLLEAALPLVKVEEKPGLR